MAKVSSLTSVFLRHRLPALATFASVLGAALAYVIFTPPRYEATARLMLDEKQVSVSNLGRDLTKLPESTPGGPGPIATQAELVKSQKVLGRAIATVFPNGGNNPEAQQSLDQLGKRLKVKIIPATNILQLQYQDRDPQMSARLLNGVAQAMVEEDVDSIRAEARSVREFLEAEVPKQRQELEQLEARENLYRKNSGVVSLPEQTKSMVDSLSQIEDQERTLSAQLRQIVTQNSLLQQVTDAGALQRAYAAVRAGQDEELKSLRVKLGDLEAKVIDARSRLGDKNPDLLALVEQRDSTRRLYSQRLARIIPNPQSVPSKNIASDELSQTLTSRLITSEIEGSALASRLRAVQAERANLQTRLTQLPQMQQPLTMLVRQRQEAEDALKLLQSKLEEARIAEAQLVGNIRVIAQAQPPTSAKWPQLPAVLAIATVAGTILAIGVVLLLEVADNTLRDAFEVEDLLNLPLLGVLPNLSNPALSLDPPEHFLDNVGLVEPYRSLLKNLEFRSPEPVRLLVVSSTIAGEGKSVVVSHLGAAAAMLSLRTLIIDADLRRPIQNRQLRLSAHPGITDVIDGTTSLLRAVQPTGIENLSLLAHGELRSRPSPLMESAAMKALIVEAVEHFDLVIVDTPPVSSCADAITLSRQGNGLVLLARPNVTPRDALLRAVSELKGNGVPLVGVVVNGMTPHTERYFRYPTDGYPLLTNTLRRTVGTGR
jgi:capsular exopolysaccharide synthesis family protein